MDSRKKLNAQKSNSITNTHSLTHRKQIESKAIIKSCNVFPDGDIAAIIWKNHFGLLTKYNLQTNDSEQEIKFKISDIFILPNGKILCQTRDFNQVNTFLYDMDKLSVISDKIENIRLSSAFLLSHHLVCIEDKLDAREVLIYDIQLDIPAYITKFVCDYSVKSITAILPNKIVVTKSYSFDILEFDGVNLKKIKTISKEEKPQLLAKRIDYTFLGLADGKLLGLNTSDSKTIKIWDKNQTLIACKEHYMPLLDKGKLTLSLDGKNVIGITKNQSDIFILNLDTFEHETIKVCNSNHRINDFVILPNQDLVFATSEGIIRFRLEHILTMKLKTVVAKELSFCLSRDPAEMVADYLGSDLEISIEKRKEIEKNPIGFFSGSERKETLGSAPLAPQMKLSSL